MLAIIVVVAAAVVLIAAIVLVVSTIFQALTYFNFLKLCKVVCYLHFTDGKNELKG